MFEYNFNDSFKAQLFSRDSKSRIKIWKIVVNKLDTNLSEIVTHSGLLGGKLTPRKTLIKEGKNMGKSNETTPYEQAMSEAKSKINRQEKKGYKSLTTLNIKVNNKGYEGDFPGYVVDLKQALDLSLPKNNTDNNNNLKPMKAQPYWAKRTKKGESYLVPRPKFPWFGQPKINGIRCTMRWEDGQGVVLSSKMGLNYTLPHITQLLKKEHFIDKDNNILVYDGELYIHKEYLSEIRSAVVKPNLKTHLVDFRIFDLAVENIDQLNRLKILKQQFEINSQVFEFSNIIKVPTTVIKTNEEAQQYLKLCIENNYEGAIFRCPKADYGFGKRVSTLVKLKEKDSAEFIVLDVIDTRDAPGVGMFICKNDLNHETFKVVPEGTIEQRKEYFKNKDNYIGKLLTVEFYERTAPPKEVPFHANGSSNVKGLCIRDYE